MDPFESSSMAHAGATGLTDDWRMRIAPPYGTSFSQPLILGPQAPDYAALPASPMSFGSLSSFGSMPSMSTPSMLSVRYFISYLCPSADRPWSSLRIHRSRPSSSQGSSTGPKFIPGSRISPCTSRTTSVTSSSALSSSNSQPHKHLG